MCVFVFLTTTITTIESISVIEEENKKKIYPFFTTIKKRKDLDQ
jgi:hypothetical protein